MSTVVRRRFLRAVTLLVLCAGSFTAVSLGDQAREPHRIRLHAGQAEAFRLRARRSELTDVVQIYVSSGSTARSVDVGIYSNAGNRPDSLLSRGSAYSLRAYRWSTVPVTPARLTSGTT